MLDIVIGDLSTGEITHVQYECQLENGRILIDHHKCTSHLALPDSIDYEYLDRYHLDKSHPNMIYVCVLKEELWQVPLIFRPSTVSSTIREMEKEITRMREKRKEIEGNESI